MRTTKSMKSILILTVLLSLCFASGCIVKGTEQTLYLDPDGGLTWTVLESRIRSDQKERAARISEERDWLERYHRGEHPMVLALEELGPWSLESRLLRERRPWTVLTEAHFASVDLALQRFLDGLGLAGSAELRTDPAGGSLRIALRPAETDEEACNGEDCVLDALFDGFEELAFLMTDCRFHESPGFELSADGGVATLQEQDLEAAAEEEREVVYELRWNCRDTPAPLHDTAAPTGPSGAER